MTHESLSAPLPLVCEWCGHAPATQRIFATRACESCVVGGRKERVRAALRRWNRGKVKS